MNYLPWLISGFAIILLTVIILTAARSRREKLDRQQQRASALGFRPLETPPPNLTEKLRQIRQSSRQGSFRLEQVYHRPDFDQDFYLVDVVDSNDSQGQWLGPETLVVVSPNLTLPRFTLASLPDMGGTDEVPEYAEKILASAFSLLSNSLGIDRIKISSSPEFNRRYVVFGRNPSAVQNLFTPSLTSYLLGITLPLTLEGEGDVFAAGLSYTSSKAREANLNDLYREVIDLARVLKN